MGYQEKIPSIFFIGHLAIDTIIRFQKEHDPTLGGSVSFGSLSLKTYTNDVKITIISNLGSLNFDKSLLDLVKNKNIDLKGLKWTETNNTNFVLDYFNHSRTLTLKSRSPNLEFKDIPKNYLNKSPDVIVLAPLCNEISYEYIIEILKHLPNAYIGIDLQGFVRKIENGHVSLIRDENIISNMEKIIDLIGDRLIIKGSEEEMKILSGKDDIYEAMNYFRYIEFNGIFIMTLGEAGSLIVKRGKEILKIPAFQSSGVVDETGAGDVYFAIFLFEFIRSDKSWKAIEKAAYLASSAASFNVEAIGPYGFETKENVLVRVNNRNYIT
ncbi:MAG: PfkB family carbohydrate kinase [Candidatus Hodarchaeota archaeon]